ncbi:MAG TPA: PKD domain-containing protein [Blastocatellia bacterium]
MSPCRMRLLFATAITLLTVGAAAGSAQAATYYVSTTGNDSNPGTISAPFLTPAQAVNVASSGDTIYMRGGSYTFTQPLNVTTDNLTIASYTGETAAITGTIDDTVVLLYMIFITGNSDSLIGLDISGGSYFGVKLQSNTGTIIQNCNIHDNGEDNIKMYLADNVLFEGNQMGPNGDLDSSDAQCINAVACNGAEVRNNYFHDSAQNGVYFKGGSTGCIVEQNLVVNCAYAGILLGQDTDLQYMRGGTQYEAINCIARNNIVINAGGAGIGTWSGDNLQVENNTLYNVAQTYNGGLYNCTNSRNVPSEQITFMNNVVVVTSSRPMFFTIDLSDQLMSDYNLYYNPNGTYPFWEETPTTGNYWSSISQWQTGMNADLHSITGQNPMLNSSANYQPEPGSPALGAGTPLSSVTNDYAGSPRPAAGPFDIGAWQMSQPAHAAPEVSVTASATSGTAPLTVNFSATVIDPGATVSTYSWAFGDGQISSQASPSHVYTSAGSYNASLTITDSTGATATASSGAITVAPRPAPQVSITASASSGQAPLSVNFSASVNDPGATVSTYNWSFGDGQSSSQATPSHVYTTVGSFTVSLTITDSTGASASATTTINTTAPPPPAAPVVSLVASSTSGPAPLPVSFSANVSDPGMQVTSYSWNFGDGQTSTVEAPLHIYSTVGTFTATLTVTTNAGTHGAASTSITVQPEAAPGAQPVTWTNVVGCSVNGSTLKKTASTTWGNAGAGSVQSIASGDGYVTFTAAENNMQRIVGLATKNFAQDSGDVSFGIMLGDGTFSVNESGQSNTNSSNYSVGDTFKVSIDSGLVHYWHNGVVFYTSSLKPAYPLWAAAILGTEGSTADTAAIASAADIGLSVQIASPAPQQVVKTTEVVDIGWTINGTADAGGTTEVMYSVNGGSSWSTIVLGIAGNVTSFDWTVAPAKTKNAIVRVIWQTPSGVLIAGTSGTFTVKSSTKNQN